MIDLAWQVAWRIDKWMLLPGGDQPDQMILVDPQGGLSSLELTPDSRPRPLWLGEHDGAVTALARSDRSSPPALFVGMEDGCVHLLSESSLRNPARSPAYTDLFEAVPQGNPAFQQAGSRDAGRSTGARGHKQ